MFLTHITLQCVPAILNISNLFLHLRYIVSGLLNGRPIIIFTGLYMKHQGHSMCRTRDLSLTASTRSYDRSFKAGPWFHITVISSLFIYYSFYRIHHKLTTNVFRSNYNAIRALDQRFPTFCIGRPQFFFTKNGDPTYWNTTKYTTHHKISMTVILRFVIHTQSILKEHNFWQRQERTM